MALRIIATCRTRNEEVNVARFCEAYAESADEILIADGGSTDDTVQIANDQPKTTVLLFDEEMEVGGGHQINPQGRHVNFLIRDAKARGADWIIFDDCDCVPNDVLRRETRAMIEYAEEQEKLAVFARRVYMWGNTHHFPEMHKADTSLWAFRADAGVRADEADPLHLTMGWRGLSNLASLHTLALHLEFPACLLHFTWQSEQATQKKLDFYRTSGIQPGARHPRKFAGPIAPTAEFMSFESG